jgi:hypothetical protein
MMECRPAPLCVRWCSQLVFTFLASSCSPLFASHTSLSWALRSDDGMNPLDGGAQGRWQHMEAAQSHQQRSDSTWSTGGSLVGGLVSRRRSLLGHLGEDHDNQPNAKGNPTCGIIDGEIIHFTQPERVPDSCFMGFNHSSCTTVEGANEVGKPDWTHKHFHKAPLCSQICSKANTIQTINGDKMRIRRYLECAATNNEVCFECSMFFLSLSLSLCPCPCCFLSTHQSTLPFFLISVCG